MPSFLTVPEELLEAAIAAHERLRTYGYTVHIERQNIEHPFTPTMLCRRPPTTLIVEVVDTYPRERVLEWLAYARSCTSDTRLAIVVPSLDALSNEELAELREAGVGVLVASASGVTEACPERDLAVNIELPSLDRYATKVRKSLGPVYEQIDRGQWKEGFDDACVALETEARKYLKRHLATGRISILKPDGTVKPTTAQQVDRMTLGALKDAFLAINLPNATDKKIGAVLKRLNPDRIRVAHKRRSTRVEATLRKNVGKQLWTIVAGLQELLH